jgi:diguanylate cyclase (GGDEF)-like protein/PAS domain S-box-containing protein
LLTFSGGRKDTMNDEVKTNKQLVDELEKLRAMVSKSEEKESGKEETEKRFGGEDRFRSVLESMSECYFELDLAGDLTFVNDSMCEITGSSREEMLGLNNRDYTTPETARRMYEIFKEIYRTGKTAHIRDYEITVKDGSRRILDLSASLMRDSEGVAIGFFGVGRNVTESREADEKLLKSEEKYRAILENIEDGYFEVDLEGNMTFLNDSMARIAGLPPDELMGMNNRDYATPETAKEMYGVFHEIYVTGKPGILKDYEVVGKDGMKKTLELSASLMRDKEGTPTGFRGIARDVTERKKWEGALRESEEKYRSVLENIQEGYFEVDLAGKLTFFNDILCTFSGYSRDELLNMNSQEYVTPESMETLLTVFGEVYRTGKPSGIVDYDIITKDGSIVSAEMSASLIRDKEGKPVGFRAVARDVTERKRKEKELRQSEEKYRNILESIEEGYYEVDLAGNFTFLNDPICRIFGYTNDEMLTMNNQDLMDKENAKRVFTTFKKVYETGEPAKGFDWEFIRKDKTTGFLAASSSLILSEEGKPIGFRGLVRDVTERKEAEERLRKSEERYRTILDNIQDAYFEVDLAGNFTFFNDSLLTIAALSRDELMGMNNLEYTSSETAKDMYTVFSEIYRTGKPAKVKDYDIIRKDGTVRICELSTTLKRDASGNPVGFCGIARDLTEKRRAEKLYQTVAEQSFAGVYVIQNGLFQYINSNAAAYSGHTPEELVGTEGMSIVHPDDREILKEHAREMLKGVRKSPYEYRMVTKDGEIRWIIETVTPILFGGDRAVLGNSMDITERKKIEDELSQSEVRYRAIFENTGTAMMIIEDDMTISMVNDEFEQMVHYPADKIVGKRKWIDFVVESDLERMMEYHRMRRVNPESTPSSYEFRITDGKNRVRDIFLAISVIPGTNRSVVSLMDVTERKEMEDELRYMSTHDSLTDLYNRAFFEVEMARFERGRVFPVSIVMADVDGLKMVNDTRGHKAGDDLLKRAAQVLREAFRADDVVARIGGDEFAVILPGADIRVVERIIGRVRESISEHNADYPDFPLSLSLGSAEGEKGDLLANVQRRADNLMYEEKLQKKGNVYNAII